MNQSNGQQRQPAGKHLERGRLEDGIRQVGIGKPYGDIGPGQHTHEDGGHCGHPVRIGHELGLTNQQDHTHYAKGDAAQGIHPGLVPLHLPLEAHYDERLEGHHKGHDTRFDVLQGPYHGAVADNKEHEPGPGRVAPVPGRYPRLSHRPAKDVHEQTGKGETGAGQQKWRYIAHRPGIGQVG